MLTFTHTHTHTHTHTELGRHKEFLYPSQKFHFSGMLSSSSTSSHQRAMRGQVVVGAHSIHIWKMDQQSITDKRKEFVLQHMDGESCLQLYVYFHGSTAPSGPRPSQCRGFTITLKLWTRNETDTETSTRKFTTLTRERRPWSQRDPNPQSQQAGSRRHTP